MWTSLSNLGDAALTWPLALTCAAWIARSRLEWRAAMHWLALLAGGAFLVGLTKILHAGCDTEIRAIGFRVISGHTMLASAVWPVALMLSLSRYENPKLNLEVVLGLVLGAIVGAARVSENAHSVSEVIAGWCVGAMVTLIFLRQTKVPALPARFRLVALATIFAISMATYGHHVPIQEAIEVYSPLLCS